MMRKKFHFTRITAVFLAVLTILSVLASCSNNTEDPKETVGSDETVMESVAETDIKDDLPDDLKFEGEKLVFISCENILFEEYTGNIIEDTIFERNKEVEDRFGITIDCIVEANAVDKVGIAVSSNSKEYDVMIDNCWETAPKIINNFFYDLRKTQYLDFEKPYWNQSFNEVMSYNDAQYAVTGAMTLSLYRNTFITVFNKDLFTEANQTFLYEYVENGTWTLDKQASLVPLFHQDNGNSVPDPSEDVFGFVSNDFVYVDPYWAASEVKILDKSIDGEYEWAFDVSKLYDMADKVLNLYYGTDGAAYIVSDINTCESQVIKMFADGNAAMATLPIKHLEGGSIREMTQEYGVVPIPKYSESQKQHYSQMLDHFAFICVPTTVGEDRADMISAVLEAMCSISNRTLRPVYYETVLRTRLAKDPQSAAMMDMIINNIVIDPGFIYSHSMGSFHQGFQAVISGKQNDSVSRYTSMTKSAKKRLDSLVGKLEKMAQD